MKIDYMALASSLRLSTAVPLVLWDKDSTIADTYHRQPMIELIRAKKATWEEYSLAAVNDTPIESVVKLMWMLRLERHNVVMSGANEISRPVVKDWFQQHHVPYDGLLLRPDGDHTSNPIFKRNLVLALMEYGYVIDLIVDDWPEAAAELRKSTGIPALVVNPCYPEGAPHGHENVWTKDRPQALGRVVR